MAADMIHSMWEKAKEGEAVRFLSAPFSVLSLTTTVSEGQGERTQFSLPSSLQIPLSAYHPPPLPRCSSRSKLRYVSAKPKKVAGEIYCAFTLIPAAWRLFCLNHQLCAKCYAQKAIKLARQRKLPQEEIRTLEILKRFAPAPASAAEGSARAV